jgi:outer membrane protein insertion porin family
MRLAAGPSIKSSLSHSWIHDTRDDPTGISGTRGTFMKLSHELAGLGGDAGFYKAEGETRLTRQLIPGTHLALSARAGSLFSLFGASSRFPDRFQLGGPLSVRMFRASSMGPRDGRKFELLHEAITHFH